MESFLEKFCKYYSLDVKEASILLDEMELIKYSKGDYIVREGRYNSSLYIIVDGIWRGWYLRDGVDVSIWFAVTGEAIFSTWGYVAEKLSPINVEAMTDSRLFCISKERLEYLFSRSIEMANFGRRLFERQFLDVESWMIDGGSMRARERYLKLVEDKPELIRSVPLKYLASYLYITPQSLSRIRAEIAGKKVGGKN